MPSGFRGLNSHAALRFRGQEATGQMTCGGKVCHENGHQPEMKE